MHLDDENIIYSYTRAEALEDGELIDIANLVSHFNKMFKYPLAVTRAVFAEYIETTNPTRSLRTGAFRIALGLFRAIRASTNPNDDYIIFDRYSEPAPALIGELKALVHGDDEGNPVITVMLPNED